MFNVHAARPTQMVNKGIIYMAYVHIYISLETHITMHSCPQFDWNIVRSNYLQSIDGVSSMDGEPPNIYEINVHILECFIVM